ncbi:hypothetical protein TraAM80_01443 [Trypanosoma rangeli]|uniref:Sec20 C-terminal domain-containing protein n=1 Tax=Trypanosoma rangeli TaxID=5698 RepID=A0A3S5ISC5_TRYRA|nr:uncharacterized protein TraAM80_01443 [Trypanosoma rangeli]RNF10627.1 hypothetical protein TraAM80_01443 [Trypanosoma rangeli]|eukprot:RNF10627.1 hypothetical protein TraAM80_01443 [Trypanosoma rangeli]
MVDLSGSDDGALSAEFMVALEQRAADTVADLNRALKAHQESQGQRTHSALVLTVTAAQRVAKLLATVKEKHPLRRHSTAAPVSLLVKLESHRTAIRRALPAAVAAAEAEAHRLGGAADTVNALRSLLHTRSLLNVELRKVQGAVDELAGTSVSLELLQSTLQDVNATVEVAQRLVRKLLSVKSTDDFLLRISVAVFVVVLAYILAQRLFGFFPTLIYQR